MRTAFNLADDALLVVKQFAASERVSLSDAVSQLVRAGAGGVCASAPGRALSLRGRFALLPQRHEIITTEHVRDLMEGCLVTFDRAVALSDAVGAQPKHLKVL